MNTIRYGEMATTTDTRGRADLTAHGIQPSGVVHRNPTTALLYTRALKRDDGVLAEGGPIVFDTGVHTGRSPKDKFLVDEPSSTDELRNGAGDRSRGHRRRPRRALLEERLLEPIVRRRMDRLSAR